MTQCVDDTGNIHLSLCQPTKCLCITKFEAFKENDKLTFPFAFGFLVKGGWLLVSCCCDGKIFIHTSLKLIKDTYLLRNSRLNFIFEVVL